MGNSLSVYLGSTCLSYALAMKLFVGLKLQSPVWPLCAKRSLSPVAGMHRRLLANSCRVRVPFNTAAAPRWQTDLPWNEYRSFCCIFILPGLAALLLWVYYSILGWTEPRRCPFHEQQVIPGKSVAPAVKPRRHSLFSMPRQRLYRAAIFMEIATICRLKRTLVNP